MSDYDKDHDNDKDDDDEYDDDDDKYDDDGEYDDSRANLKRQWLLIMAEGGEGGTRLAEDILITIIVISCLIFVSFFTPPPFRTKKIGRASPLF